MCIFFRLLIKPFCLLRLTPYVWVNVKLSQMFHHKEGSFLSYVQLKRKEGLAAQISLSYTRLIVNEETRGELIINPATSLHPSIPIFGCVLPQETRAHESKQTVMHTRAHKSTHPSLNRVGVNTCPPFPQLHMQIHSKYTHGCSPHPKLGHRLSIRFRCYSF